ncbi:hypothetical protein CCS41_06825 [Candidatus Fukatsuia symbiotica]|uniref:Uncharacterized protein n=2 Tax=Candidatus Fukatsuia TaxID=1927833 RepID=A0A2U8I510_9GAMM|nr:hypothetical protein [Candidatus Fukatsuia symbiotica]AWK14250.1 hypothetical protein CCS41_06825 [Candidatus Fukatsuia symbiotica]
MLNETVWAQVIALLSEPERLKKEYEQRLTQASEHSGQTADAERLKKQENQLNVGRSRLIDSFAEGLIGKTDFETTDQSDDAQAGGTCAPESEGETGHREPA